MIATQNKPFSTQFNQIKEWNDFVLHSPMASIFVCTSHRPMQKCATVRLLSLTEIKSKQCNRLGAPIKKPFVRDVRVGRQLLVCTASNSAELGIYVIRMRVFSQAGSQNIPHCSLLLTASNHISKWNDASVFFFCVFVRCCWKIACDFAVDEQNVSLFCHSMHWLEYVVCVCVCVRV